MPAHAGTVLARRSARRLAYAALTSLLTLVYLLLVSRN